MIWYIAYVALEAKPMQMFSRICDRFWANR